MLFIAERVVFYRGFSFSAHVFVSYHTTVAFFPLLSFLPTYQLIIHPQTLRQQC